MLGSIKGKIIHKKEKWLLVENNGLGYKINTLFDFITKSQEGENIFLWLHSHIREDAFDLYGFSEYSDLEMFQLLLNVSGIGPKAAITILNTATTDTLKKSIANADISYLNKISGIGKKTAEKIILELKDKVGEIEKGENLKEELETLEALKSLGYSHNDAREVLKNIPESTDTNTKIKEALRLLGKSR